MMEKTSDPDVSRESLVAEAVDGFEQLLHRGDHPDIEQYVQRYPRISDVLRRVLPALEVVDMPEPGPDGTERKTLGDFRIRRELGRGGMGVVYEAEQISLGRRVALKVLPFAAVMDPRQLQRFKNEAQAAAHLHHTHIVPVHSVGCERGVHYFAMQFIEGLTVAQAIEELRGTAGRDMPARPSSAALESITKGKSTRSGAYCRAVARLGIQAAEALDHAHEQGVVHRDIKPANLIVDHGGQLWITDFGLASFASNPGVTRTGDLVGTVRYMSPEQALAKRAPIDHRTDIYSLGVTLYELLTLETAFKGDDPHQVIQDIALKEPASAHSLNPAVPAELETILLKAMAKDPAERFETAQALAGDLARYLENRPIHARRPSRAQRAAKWARRHAALVGGITAVLTLAVAGLLVGATLLWRERARTGTAYADLSREQARTERQRDRAETNLGLALEALDNVYLDEAEITPRLRPGLSRDLLEKGLGFYKRFAAENGDNPEVRRETGRAFTRAGMIYGQLGRPEDATEAYDSAIARLRETIRLQPRDVRAHYILGNALAANGQIDAAIAAYREATRVEPGFVEAHGNLGILLCERRRRYDEAVVEFREAIRLKPDCAENHTNLGIALAEQGRLDEAVAEFREAIRRKPGLAEAHFDLAVTLRRQGRLDEAVAAYGDAIRLKPDDADGHKGLGDALAARGRLQEAVAAYRAAVRVKPDLVEAYGNLGNALVAQGRLDEAVAAFREVIRLDPDDALGHTNLGAALRRQGRLDEAMAALREAIRLKPHSANAHVNLGNLLATQGRLDEAVAAYREAIRLEPDLVGAHGNLGAALAVQGRLDEAIAAYREALRLEPDPRRQNGLARLLATCPDVALRNPEEAVELAGKAVSLAPRAGDIFNTLGVAQYRAGHFKEALDALEKAMHLREGGDAHDWLFVAMAKWRLGDRDAARAWYDRSLAWTKEHAPEDPELKRFAAEAAELLETKND